MMNEQIFWDIIDQSRKSINTNFETQCVNISEILMEYSEEDIVEFEHQLRLQIEKANTWPLMAASFVVCSFISDDVYEDFRAWVVGQGKANFDKILKNPNAICELIKPGQVSEMGGEYLLFAAVNAYLEKIGSTDEDEDQITFFKKIPHVDELAIEQHWPESKNELRKMFPQLFDTFWNEKRINELIDFAESEDDDM